MSGTKFVFRRFDHQHIKTVCRPRVEVVICYRYEDWSRAAPVTKPVRAAATDKQFCQAGAGSFSVSLLSGNPLQSVFVLILSLSKADNYQRYQINFTQTAVPIEIFISNVAQYLVSI